jgi:uncharacterized PurR-regulated membrane protein YhhQ (DUF165 family)
MYYIGLAFIYIALSVVFIADVVRNDELATWGKVAWIVALLAVPVLAWPVYGIIRLRQRRGL